MVPKARSAAKARSRPVSPARVSSAGMTRFENAPCSTTRRIARTATERGDATGPRLGPEDLPRLRVVATNEFCRPDATTAFHLDLLQDHGSLCRHHEDVVRRPHH